MIKTVKRSYRFRIYPNPSQKELIEKTLGCCRQVYNDFLSMCIESYEANKKHSVDKYKLMKLLPEYKKREINAKCIFIPYILFPTIIISIY